MRRCIVLGASWHERVGADVEGDARQLRGERCLEALANRRLQSGARDLYDLGPRASGVRAVVRKIAVVLKIGNSSEKTTAAACPFSPMRSDL
jgi:hypothetical protein